MPLLNMHAIPFYMHTALELPASLNFFLHPLQQLLPPISSGSNSTLSLAPSASIVVRQYALLLFVSCCVSLTFAVRPHHDNTTRRGAGALALYHLGPLARAISRLGNGESPFEGGLGGPAVHAVGHGMCFVALLAVCVGPSVDAGGEPNAVAAKKGK